MLNFISFEPAQLKFLARTPVMKTSLGRRIARDEIPLTPEDLARLPEIIGAADHVRRSRGRDGTQMLVFTKREGAVTTMVEEVRGRRGQLGFKTMWRKERTGGGSGALDGSPGTREAPQLTSETTRVAAEGNIGETGLEDNESASSNPESGNLRKL